MACDAGLSVPTLSFNSSKIKLMLVLITLVCETCVCTVPETSEVDQINQLEEKGTEVPSLLHSLENQDDGSDVGDDDLIVYKRHLGALAAMSGGSKPSFRSKSFVPPSKKHLGSIAAGRKLELHFPTKLEMYKRHLGALRAQSGFKPRPLTRSLKESLAYQMDSPADTEFETPSMTYNYGGVRIPARYDDDSHEIQISPEILLMNGDEPTDLNELQHMPLSQMDEVANENVGGTLSTSDDDDATIKSKRFLGTLARGGWFPRQFRGIVSENSFGKRHIGSLARLGWMPQPHVAKANGRLGMMMEDTRGEIGLKRNDMSPRRRMLYHFSAPSLWTSPRGK